MFDLTPILGPLGYQPIQDGNGSGGPSLNAVGFRSDLDQASDQSPVHVVGGRPMTTDRADIVQAKERMPMLALLGRLCPHWRKKNPIRADDARNSFHAGEDGWHDYGTGDKGDQIDFLQKFEGLEVREAIRRFLELAGVEVPRMAGRVAKQPTIDWPACVASFTATKAQELVDYRGYSPPFVHWLKAQTLIGIYRDDREFCINCDTVKFSRTFLSHCRSGCLRGNIKWKIFSGANASDFFHVSPGQ